MAHQTGLSAATTADAVNITSDSTVGGPTVEDDLDALDAADATNNALAIHKATAGEIAALTGKTVLVVGDLLLAEDTESDPANAKAKVTVGAVLATAGQVTNLPAATILVTDKLAFEDASDTAKMKEATVQELFAAPGWVTGLAGATVVGADLFAFEDASGSLAIVKVTATALALALAPLVNLVVEVADDAAAAVLSTTGALYLAGTTLLAAKVIATTSSRPNQRLSIRMVAAVLGTYTLVVSEGVLTFTDAGAHAVVIRNAAGDAWLVLDPGTATIV